MLSTTVTREGVSLRFIVNYPETQGLERDLLDSGEIGEVAAAAEAAGLDGFALTEHPIPGATWLERGGHQTLEPFVGLAFAAAATERIRLLTHIVVAPYRNPFHLAKAAASNGSPDHAFGTTSSTSSKSVLRSSKSTPSAKNSVL